MSDHLLRQGLFEMHDPELSSSFDDIIINAISKPVPVWKSWLFGMRPVVASACCSALIITVLVHLPEAPSPVSIVERPVPATIQKALDNPEMIRGTVALLMLQSNMKQQQPSVNIPVLRKDRPRKSSGCLPTHLV